MQFSAGKTCILASTQMLLWHLPPALTFLQTNHTSHTATALCYNCSLPQQIIIGFNKNLPGMLRGHGKVLDVHMNSRLPKFHSDRIWSVTSKSQHNSYRPKTSQGQTYLLSSLYLVQDIIIIIRCSLCPIYQSCFCSPKKIYIIFNEQ